MGGEGSAQTRTRSPFHDEAALGAPLRPHHALGDLGLRERALRVGYGHAGEQLELLRRWMQDKDHREVVVVLVRLGSGSPHPYEA